MKDLRRKIRERIDEINEKWKGKYTVVFKEDSYEIELYFNDKLMKINHLSYKYFINPNKRTLEQILNKELDDIEKAIENYDSVMTSIHTSIQRTKKMEKNFKNKEEIRERIREKVREINERWKGKYEVVLDEKKTVIDIRIKDIQRGFFIFVKYYTGLTKQTLLGILDFLENDIEKMIEKYDRGEVERRELVFNTARAESLDEFLKKV